MSFTSIPPEMPICTSCGERVPLGSSYIALFMTTPTESGLQVPFWFKFGCEHHHVLGAIHYFGSEDCILDWLREHPDFIEAYNDFAASSSGRCH